jgi:hypothetical protein
MTYREIQAKLSSKVTILTNPRVGPFITVHKKGVFM